MTKREIYVITNHLNPTRGNIGQRLLDILGELGSVSLVTADLPANSSFRDNREFVELTRKGTDDSLTVAVTRLLFNQIWVYNSIKRCTDEATLFFEATTYLLSILFTFMINILNIEEDA